jgi:hypothetical protein
MKQAILLLAITIASTFVFSQTTNDLQVSLSGIGGIKLGMSIADVEKITGQKINSKLGKGAQDYAMDTVSVALKGATLEVIFYNQYIDQQKSEVSVYGITSSSSLCKTKSGIIIGDDKIKIVTTYDTYAMEIYPYIEDVGNGQYKPSKTKSTITIHGQEENGVIIFNLTNNKVVSFTVSIFEGC